jgi:hypothetical protein
MADKTKDLEQVKDYLHKTTASGSLANKAILIAPCGMNCAVCMAFLRKKNKCSGCRGNDTNKPVTRINCKIKTCSTFREGNVKYCFQCEKYPCKSLKHLDNRYRIKYKMSMIENLEQIKKSGLKKFIENEKIKWTCSKCQGTICVHKGYCFTCGELRNVC